jgi:hypothetical protein
MLFMSTVNTTETIEIEYQLPQGAHQAVRVRYDYQGNISTCPQTSYGDVDDLGKILVLYTVNGSLSIGFM